MQPDFYRLYQREFMPFPRKSERVAAGQGAEEAFRRILSDHPRPVRANGIAYAPFLMARGAAAILETAVHERPAYVFDDDFIAELASLYGSYFVRRTDLDRA